ncbi:calmodulin-binding receptor-like cytoplasmic kinase 3 [Solanum stenotomum]|uniref:calmodulin-binding receptor-like cytoplasmic kinase 3 n=1 Tax=Solanum stenotomum TaxID=172797 RepID=UPI0020D041B6|nr:calmodulin-binding receptor-like cytoplasmic kinase 3 [Solanum stenotomum]XP_049413041.1 calmodulin-binding receptor-like cytoplasmic kinase 3 [Solanum stenotomum]
MKMAVVVLCLLLLLQFPLIFASRLLGHKEGCGIYRVDYSDDLNRQVFYVNGILADKDLFCKALKFDHAEHCVIQNVGFQYCGLDLLIDELHFKSGRKFIHKVVRQGSNGHNFDDTSQKAKEKHADDISVTPKNLVMAVPAFFILCCGLICPCCRSRKKETDQSALVKDPNSMDSTCSLEMNFVPEKAPGSPLRVPASPLRVPPSPSRFSMSPKLNRIGSIHLNMNQALKATQNFSSSLKIGEGGFGMVYKAQLPDGQTVAIKRAKKEHFDALSNEFRSEVELLAKIEHRNLVRLLGFVDKGNERLIITEYVANGTLREHLDGGRGKILDFNQRLEIAIDIAHGLTYLHLYAEKQIIHRDVKSSNILLTESMRAKVADFGFARLGGSDADKTHVSTQVKGTVGYLDPEYMKTYQLTPKSDVYSFGVLLLEILTGRRPVELRRSPDERVTLRWVFRKYNEGSVLEMLDPQMKESVNGEILVKMFGLAIQCAAPTRKDRPDMKIVGEQLWAIRMDYLRNGRRQ